MQTQPNTIVLTHTILYGIQLTNNCLDDSCECRLQKSLDLACQVDGEDEDEDDEDDEEENKNDTDDEKDKTQKLVTIKSETHTLNNNDVISINIPGTKINIMLIQ